MDPEPLNLDDLDVVLAPAPERERAATWITVGNVSLHLRRDRHSVRISALPLGHEMHEPVDEMCIWFSDMQKEIDDAGAETCPSCGRKKEGPA